MDDEGGVAAREVLPADAANLVSMQVAPAKEGGRDAHQGGCPAQRRTAAHWRGAFDLPPRRLPSGFDWQRRRVRVKTQREKAEEKRQAKLEEIREQVDSGTLVIRPMTAEESQRYPPRPADRPRADRRR